MGPSEAGYWALRPRDAARPEVDRSEQFLLSHARMRDAQDSLARAGKYGAIAEWELPVTAADAPARAEALSSALWDQATVMVCVLAEASPTRVVARSLIVADDHAGAARALESAHARLRETLDRPGSRLRPPRLRPPEPGARPA